MGVDPLNGEGVARIRQRRPVARNDALDSLAIVYCRVTQLDLTKAEIVESLVGGRCFVRKTGGNVGVSRPLRLLLLCHRHSPFVSSIQQILRCPPRGRTSRRRELLGTRRIRRRSTSYVWSIKRKQQPLISWPRHKASHPKLCQKLRRRPRTLADATDAETQRFQHWPTPTDARTWLPKQARYRAAPRPVSQTPSSHYPIGATLPTRAPLREPRARARLGTALGEDELRSRRRWRWRLPRSAVYRPPRRLRRGADRAGPDRDLR